MKEKFLNLKSSKLEQIEVDGIGPVFVRVMSGKERDRWEASVIQDGRNNFDNVRARLAVICLCDEHGQRIFNDQDADQLGEISSIALDQIFDACMNVNKLRKVDVDSLKKTSL